MQKPEVKVVAGHCNLYSAALIDRNRGVKKVPEAVGDSGSLSGEGFCHYLCGQTGTCRQRPQRPDESIIPLHVITWRYRQNELEM